MRVFRWRRGGARRHVRVSALRRISLFFLLLALPLAAGCADSGPTGPRDPVVVTVMTRNLYVGADFGPFFQVGSLAEVPAAAGEFWSEVQETDFAARAGALAVEIEDTRPHLVGLQEVSLFRVQSPGDFFLGDLRPATDTVLDHLALLLDSLSARGLSYHVASRSPDFDVEGPLEVPGGRDDLRLTDREVILARGDVAVSSPRGEHYERALLVAAGVVSVRIRKGWASVDARIGGADVRFVSTHLEIREFGPEVQLAQADELLEVTDASPLPVVLVGDFNSAADGSTTATYGRLTGSGFRDAWSEARPADPGPTCCHSSDLRDPNSSLDSRIDLVLLGPGVEVRRVDRLGAAPGDRTASGLWPSDHAGVVATVAIP